MTVEDFIKKAKNGGWKPLPNVDYSDESMFGVKNIIWDLPCIVLRPQVWQAVGKVEGWQREHKGCGGNMVCPRYASYCCMEGWKANMHRLIDALAEGKTIEEFLQTL